MKNIVLKPHGQETVRAVFKDKDGNETSAHGTVAFTSSDETIATVATNDGITAVVTSVGPIGSTTITATDAQDNTSDLVKIDVLAGEATSQTPVADAVGSQAPTADADTVSTDVNTDSVPAPSDDTSTNTAAPASDTASADTSASDSAPSAA